MNPNAFSTLGDTLSTAATVAPAITYYGPQKQVPVDQHIKSGAAWIKAYSPIQEVGQHITEDYLVIVDAGGSNLEVARRASARVRHALHSTQRQPNGYRLMRLVPLEEANYWRFQHTYRRILRPENEEL